MQINDSKRLKFRLMDMNDAQPLWEIDQDPIVMKFLTGGIPTTMDKIKTVLIPRMEAYRKPKLGWGIWQVSHKLTNEYLGWVLVRPMAFFTDAPNEKNLELGWRFFQHAWGKGYATEAAIAIKNAVVANSINVTTQSNSIETEKIENEEKQKVTHLSALAVVDNLASIAVMKKIGMHFVKSYLHRDPIGDFDAVHYQMSVKS